MSWQIFDAKARFSEFLDATLKDGPQIVTKRGVEAAVLISMDEWKHLKNLAKQAAPDPLLAPHGPRDLNIPSRRALPLRPFTFDDAD